jgi:hypothetical protein
MAKRPDPGKKTRNVSGKSVISGEASPTSSETGTTTLSKYSFFFSGSVPGTGYLPFIMKRDETKILKPNIRDDWLSKGDG